MINLTLFKKEFKSNYKLFVIFLAILIMYIVIIVMMFDPELGNALDEMAKAMPQLMAAFGMVNSGNTLITFMASYLYGFILTLLPLIYIIFLSIRLITQYVDNGSMSYLLATPNSRKKLITTQMVIMLLWVLVLYLSVIAVGIFSAQLMFPGDLDISRFLILNLNLIVFMYAISGLCFMVACSFDETKKVIGITTGISVMFYLIQMLTSMNERLSGLKYFTIYTLFPYSDIASGVTNGTWQMIILFISGTMMFFIGRSVFIRRDLSI